MTTASFSERPLYPYLLVAYFVLFVFSENLGSAYLVQVLRPLLVLLGLAAAGVAILSAVTRSINAGSALLALFGVLLVAQPGIEQLAVSRLGMPRLALYLVEALAAVALGSATVIGVKRWGSVNSALNLVALLLLALTLAPIARFGFAAPDRLLRQPVARSVDDTPVLTTDRVSARPDVYYILLDAYARADVLRDYFGYDNSKFVGFLRNSGFTVADRSYANYPLTGLVVNSTLNMDYIADASGFTTLPDGTRVFPNMLIADNRVGGAFAALGYRLVTIQSVGRYTTTANAEVKSLRQRKWSPDEFEAALINTTALPRLLDALVRRLFSDRDRIDYALEEIVRQVSTPGPKLVVAHIMAPHQPFVYARDGSVPAIDPLRFGRLEHLPNDIRGYRDQIHYLNTQLTAIVTAILRNSAPPPIIILQGDHGLRVTLNSLGTPGSETPYINDSCPREVLANLSAVYLPDPAHRSGIPDDLSSVNTFRLVLDSYFDTGLGLLKEQSFFPRIQGSIDNMSFTDITDKRASCSSSWEQAMRNAQD